MVLAATCWLSVVARGVSCPMACGILVPRPGIELTSRIARQIPNHWTTREVPRYIFDVAVLCSVT